jgi:hypothetical protein
MTPQERQDLNSEHRTLVLELRDLVYDDIPAPCLDGEGGSRVYPRDPVRAREIVLRMFDIEVLLEDGSRDMVRSVLRELPDSDELVAMETLASTAL